MLYLCVSRLARVSIETLQQRSGIESVLSGILPPDQIANTITFLYLDKSLQLLMYFVFLISSL